MRAILSELPETEAGHFILRRNTRLHFSRFPFLPRHVLHQIELPLVFRSLDLDAYLDPDYVLPNLPGVACHCVIHDTTPYAAPHLMGIKAQLIYRTNVRISLKRARGLICVSNRTHARMAELFPSLESKLRVVPSCLAPKFSFAGAQAYRHLDSVNIETIHGAISIPQPFILHVGVPGPRKNIPALMAAFSEVKLRMFPYRLVFVGGHAKRLPKQSQSIPQVALPDGSTMQALRPLPDVLHLGQVSDDDLVTLYRHADLLVLPSLEEGFGYPALEALGFRTPVLTSVDSPLANLPGVAVIPDVTDPGSIAAALIDALRHLPDLASQLSSGFSLDYYSWDRYLKDMLAVIS